MLFRNMTLPITLAAACAMVQPASAAIVLGTASIYNSGTGSTAPVSFDISGPSITISATGTIVMTPPYSNNPDGVGSLPAAHNIAAANGLSGISLPTGRAGALVAAFVTASGPASGSTAPVTLVYSLAALEQASYSPLLNQVFFVGDGKASGGAFQSFVVPTGATRVIFGIADAQGYNGEPDAYFDNSGFYSVSVFAAVPEPGTWAMMIGGFGMIGGAMRRRRGVQTLATA